MRRLLASLATVTALAIGTIWTPATSQAAVNERSRPRNVYCHYRTLDGRATWNTAEVKATIRCAASRFGVSAATALYVADRESNFIPTATNAWSQTCGLFQHMPRYWPGRVATFRDRHPFWHVYPSCYNPRTNALVSLDMAAHGGWGPWSL